MENKEKILVAEDDESICKFLRAELTANGYGAIFAKTGAGAIDMITSHCPDCILLDLGLPDMDGNDVIKSVRAWSTTPIIVISARIEESDKANALDLGADDYLTKPFGTTELLARIRTAIRHTRTASEQSEVALNECYNVGDLTIDYRKRRVYLAGNDVGLTPNEYKIVALLGIHAGRVLTYKRIMCELWGPMVNSDNKILRVHMANIRRKIDPNPDKPPYITTEVGFGYRMREDDE